MVWPAGEAAFVTGAASGIGRGIARALAASGAKVALADIDEAKVRAAADELTSGGATVTAIALDVSDPAAWPEAADRAESDLGPISILVSNAGIVSPGSLVSTSYDAWQRTFRINVDSQFLGLSAFLPRFLERGTRAHILNTASMGGLIPIPGVGPYCASKFASVGLSLVLREELRGTAVGVSVLTPGTVVTGLTTDQATGDHPAGADADRVGEQVLEALQAGRFLIPTHGDFEPIVTGLHREIEQALRDTDDRHGPDPSVAMLLAGVDPVDSVLGQESRA